MLSVGDSTGIGNGLWFDDADHESVILPKGAPEIEQIRNIIKKAARKIQMRKVNNIYKIDAWVDTPKDTNTAAGSGR